MIWRSFTGNSKALMNKSKAMEVTANWFPLGTVIVKACAALAQKTGGIHTYGPKGHTVTIYGASEQEIKNHIQEISKNQ
jgi:hypothetical protein